jgi:predicted phosphodiesterase
MKIGILSDNHGSPFPTLGQLDLLLHAGDFYGHEKNRFGQWEKIIPSDFEYPCSTLAVRGNHDVADPVNFFNSPRDISGQCQKVAPGLFVVGVGWHGEQFYDIPSERDIQAVCTQALEDCRLKMNSGDQVILLSHYGVITPPEVAGQSIGVYAALNQMATILKPVLIIQGHLHEWAGKSCVWNGATLICAGPQATVIDFPA